MKVMDMGINEKVPENDTLKKGEQSSNKARYESAPTAAIIDIIRTAMGDGCIRPCHVYDAVDELICRIQALENRPKRNCDVGTAEEQYWRHDKFCDAARNRMYGCHCDDAPKCIFCFAKWEQMPYAEGGAK